MHAERCFAIASAITRVAHTAGPIAALGDTEERALAAYGVIDQDTLGMIAAARIVAVQDRARELMGTQAAVRRAA